MQLFKYKLEASLITSLCSRKNQAKILNIVAHIIPTT